MTSNSVRMLNSKSTVFLAFAILFSHCVSLQAAAQGSDLVTNGGFEDGEEGWRITSEIVTDAKAAHSGKNCVFGEVTEPRKAHFIRRPFALKETNLYRLVFWARATNRTKVAVWIQRGKDRRNLAQLQKVPRKWRQYEAPFSAPATGEWTLELVAPSSHGAPAGKMWIDDVSLFEVELPPVFDVTQDEGVSENPAIAADGKGNVYCAWISYQASADHLRVARIAELPAEKPKVMSKWEAALPRGAYVSSVDLVGTEDGAWLAAACEVDGNWDIYMAQVNAKGLSKPMRLTQSAATDIKPAISGFGGNLWAAWESNRDGSRQIYVANVTDGKLGEPKRMSKLDTSNYNPCLSGNWIVWESFRESNYDIYASYFDGKGWQPEQRLTSDIRIEHRPVVASTQDGAWVAWEMMEYRGYRTSAATWKRVLVARLAPDGLRAPKDMFNAFPNWSEQPTITLDESGRVWVAARKSRGQHAGWDVIAQAFTGREWTGWRQLTARPGRANRAPLVPIGDRILVAAQADSVPGSWATIEQSKGVSSNIVLCSLNLDKVPSAAPAGLSALGLPKTDFAMAAQRHQYGEELPRRFIEYKGEKFYLYWGQFHEHSDISVCNRRGDLTPDDNYTHNRDIHRLDFSALTDHGYNFSPHVWNYTSKLARSQNDPNRFVTFLAEEWTSTFERYSDEHPYGYYGHRNLIFADAYFPKWFNARDDATPSQLWAELRAMRANFVQIPHQLADTGNVPTDWNFTDEVAQPVAEVFQARGSYEYKGAPRQAGRTADGYFIQDAWAKGVVIGVIASPDHGGGLGKAAVYAPKLTREAILDACRARHTYGTTAAKVFLDVRVNGHLMGEKVSLREGAGKPVLVHVQVAGAGEIDRVEVCRNNEFVYTKKIDGSETEFDFRDAQTPSSATYYYVRVVQKDNEIAWSSPVWLVKE